MILRIVYIYSFNGCKALFYTYISRNYIHYGYDHKTSWSQRLCRIIQVRVTNPVPVIILSLPKWDSDRGPSPHQLYHLPRIAVYVAAAKLGCIPSVCDKIK